MRSMTGYGEATAKINGLTLHVQVRSVNHRFFTCQLNLPEILSERSSDIENIIRKHIPRGSVNFALKIESTGRAPEAVFNLPLAKTYYRQLKSLQKALKLQEEVSLNHLLNLVRQEPRESLPAGFLPCAWPRIEKVVLNSVTNLIKMREREGQRLKNALQQIIRKMLAAHERIKKLAPLVTVHYREMLNNRLKEIWPRETALNSNGAPIPNNESFHQRLAQEVALFAQRADITEEIQRLHSHLEEFLRTLNQPKEVGKRLDFLTQEMLREVNTIASKASNTEIAYHTINLKSEIEKLKEQVQNIE